MPSRFPNNPSAKPTQDDISVFCNAAKTGDIRTITDYLDRFGDNIINSRDTTQDTAFTWAAWTGQKAVLQLLLDRGVDIDQKGMTGRTAIGWAANGGRRDVVEFLLEKGANPEIPDQNNKTPAELADTNGHSALATFIRENGVKKRKEAAELAARKKADEEGKAMTQQRLDNLKKHKPPKLKFG